MPHPLPQPRTLWKCFAPVATTSCSATNLSPRLRTGNVSLTSAPYWCLEMLPLWPWTDFLERWRVEINPLTRRGELEIRVETMLKTLSRCDLLVIRHLGVLRVIKKTPIQLLLLLWYRCDLVTRMYGCCLGSARMLQW